MKKQLLGFLAGVALTATVLTLSPAVASAAQSIQVLFNQVNISVDGKQEISAGESYTLANGTTVPSSIVYNGTTYLPVRRVSEITGLGIDWIGEDNLVAITMPDGISGETVSKTDYQRVLTKNNELKAQVSELEEELAKFRALYILGTQS